MSVESWGLAQRPEESREPLLSKQTNPGMRMCRQSVPIRRARMTREWGHMLASWTSFCIISCCEQVAPAVYGQPWPLD